MSETVRVFENNSSNLVIPVLAPVYNIFAQPFAWVAFRVAVGGMLALEGWPKIIAPFAQIGFLESQGYHPGWLWSPFLATLQFVGGLFIAIGLLTRPVALANGFMLALTFYFHYSNPYGDVLLTQAGLDALKAGGDTLFTPEALALLTDGGRDFLHEVQAKAELASLFWTGGAFLFAAFGGGYLSVDRLIVKRQF